MKKELYELFRESDGVLLGYFDYQEFMEFVEGLTYRELVPRYDCVFECSVRPVYVNC